ncbi:hypothetical protein JD844_021742 [Phrynosoma platyrhinos]|uniref:Dickkopf N-terminal cysteine-rich domain-containing protein n=1 Tax=Phrynosoma platyrhinos TaxID=52577 RepID=A0ABQ7STX5_PHRPL|nr:hypothetical protein JD844_021742 [Phrynosoma platyrhinos]
MFSLGSRLLFLPILLGMVYAAPVSEADGEEQPKEEIILTFPRDEASLNEMFREVEELMEDTQYKLRNAVKEVPLSFQISINSFPKLLFPRMEAEEEDTKRLTVDFEKLPANYHNESHTDTRIGNKTIHTHQEIDKATDNKTGFTSYSETVITSIKEGGENKRNHECIIDEDCETGKYCEFSGLEYKCHGCKTEHKVSIFFFFLVKFSVFVKLLLTCYSHVDFSLSLLSTPPPPKHCSRDVECCGRQLCVWGECMKAASRGENGTICENQHDCSPGMCCAFSKDRKSELVMLIGTCAFPNSHSSDSLCEPSFNKTQTEDEKPLVADELSLLDFVTEDIPGDYEEKLMVQKGLEEQTVDSEELDIASDLLLGDEI